MNGNLTTNITLSLKQLFIAYHGIRVRLNRPGVSEKDQQEEHEALDEINKAIRQIKYGDEYESSIRGN